MKNKYMLIVLAAVVVNACVSFQINELSENERLEANIIGSVSAKFSSFQWLNIISPKKIKARAYELLRSNAAKEYPGNIDIVNIRIKGGPSLGEALWVSYPFLLSGSLAIIMFDEMSDPEWTTARNSLLIMSGIIISLPAILGNFQRITVTGDVVLLDAEVGVSLSIRNKIQGLLPQINDDLIDKLPEFSRIAVLGILSNDQSLSENVIDDIEFNLLNSKKFLLVDRRRLDDIIKEQNFQMSGDVSDDSAVRIGHMLGANIVIIGNITTTAASGRVTVRALDVETGQVIVIATQQF